MLFGNRRFRNEKDSKETKETDPTSLSELRGAGESDELRYFISSLGILSCYFLP